MAIRKEFLHRPLSWGAMELSGVASAVHVRTPGGRGKSKIAIRPPIRAYGDDVAGRVRSTPPLEVESEHVRDNAVCLEAVYVKIGRPHEPVYHADIDVVRDQVVDAREGLVRDS